MLIVKNSFKKTDAVQYISKSFLVVFMILIELAIAGAHVYQLFALTLLHWKYVVSKCTTTAKIWYFSSYIKLLSFFFNQSFQCF